MNTKKLVTIVTTITLLTSLLVPMLFIQLAQAADPSDWYMTVNGVLDTDYYTLYPYETDRLEVGMSKYGELIDSETNVGLEYANARDPFAAPAGATLDNTKLPKNVWINGWYIALTYNHASWGERYVWAGALFADLTDYGGPWLRVDNSYLSPVGLEKNEDFRDLGREIDENGDIIGTTAMWGGRKTNGTATTDDIQVLYDGPRKFVAIVVNHIYDYHEASQSKLHLVDVAFTVIFNKVKKEVILLKDVKMMDQAKYVLSPLKLDIPNDSEIEIPRSILAQFSNREEWDLGNSPTYESYIHFYTEYNDEGLDTCYNEDWTLLPTLPAGYSVVATDLDTSVLAKHGSEPGSSGTYDMAQVISNDLKYVAWAAYWPSLSDWSADAGSGRANLWWRAMKDADPHDTDSFATPNDEPFLAPLTIGEWDFVLSDEIKTVNSVNAAPQFRGVTVYGLTDLNDGDDEDRTGGSNVIDKEVMYQLDEVYNPWDLSDAVHKKDTSRWLKWATSGPITLDPPALNTTAWDAYSAFSERVVHYASTGVTTLWKRGEDYTLSADGTTITLISSIGSGNKLKVLWSSDDWYDRPDDVDFGPGRYEWTTVGRDAFTIDSAGAALVTASFKQKNYTIGLAGVDMWDTLVAAQMPYIMTKFGTGDNMADYVDTIGRAALNDDWCTYWAVASSNVIGVGGPLANMLSYYANDFTDAIYGLVDYAGTAYSGEVTGVPCWNRGWNGTWNVYSSADDETKGYAVISTYLDINGTEIFEVWGHYGRDTYYATQWLHGDAERGIAPGIVQLQSAPAGITSIILEIDYTDPQHPTFCIPELLGTISETEWTHTYINPYTGEEVTEVKGGIHDP